MVDLGYKPRAFQAYLHANMKRFNVIVLHRRAGKSIFAIHEMLDQGLLCPHPNPQLVYLAPTYTAAKRIIWQQLKDLCEKIPGTMINEAELRIEIPRPAMKDKVKFILLGAENSTGIRGLYIDYAILDEAAYMEPAVWTSVVRPALADRLGKALFISTPQGLNWFHDIYMQAEEKNDWFRYMLKASESGIIPQEELQAAKELMSDSEYMTEFEVSFAAALVGAYFGQALEKAEEQNRIARVPYDPAMTVKVYLDLGMDDSTAIWFTQNLGGREIRVIDYVEESGQGLDYFADLLRKKGYSYEEIVLPHDGAVRELGTGKSRLETLKKLLRGVRIRVARKHKVEDTINAARLLLAKCWFDKDNCARGINALKNYQRAWDPKLKIFQNKPKHDWASHGADAFRLLAMEINENGPTPEDRARYPRFADSKFDVV